MSSIIVTNPVSSNSHSGFKSLAFFFLFLGIVMITIGYIKADKPEPIVEYRYVPRSFKEEQENPIPLMANFGTMFTERTPWQKYRSYKDTFPWERLGIHSRTVLPHFHPKNNINRSVGVNIT